MDSAEVGRLAAAHGITLSELIPVEASLEEAFMELTRDTVEYQAAGADPMTDAMIAPLARTTGRRSAHPPFGDVLRSEWTKLRSVRSTFWALTATVVLGIALGPSSARPPPTATRRAASPTS